MAYSQLNRENRTRNCMKIADYLWKFKMGECRLCWVSRSLRITKRSTASNNTFCYLQIWLVLLSLQLDDHNKAKLNTAASTEESFIYNSVLL